MFGNVTACARRVGGIALLAVRASVRTRLVATLLVLLAACVTVLPGVVKGDGTAEGELQILIAYTLGLSFGILCLAVMWAACALFAAEIDSQRMQLSAVKPVRAAEFWLGKWLALLGLNALFLLAVYAGVYAQVRWQSHRRGWGASDLPASRHVTRPVLPTPREEALATYAQMRRQNAVPEGTTERAVLRTLEEKAVERYDIISPGDEVAWRFRLGAPLREAEAVTVRVKFDTEYSTREHVAGVCKLRCLETGAQAVEVPLSDFTQNAIEFAVDARAFAAWGADATAEGLREFELTFRHTGDAKRSSALMLRFRQDVALLTAGGSFEGNLARSAFVHWSVLALLAAFGLTLSACFSFPVAAFAATVLLVLTMVGNAVVQVVSEEDSKAWQNKAGIWVSRQVHEVTRHAVKANPLEAVREGEQIQGAVIGDALVWNVLLLPLVFAALGCAALRQRELAEAG